MLNSVTIQDFRCLVAAELDPGPELNLIFGPNAAGKTSILEALFFLGRARSFRTARIGPLIRAGESALTLNAKLADQGAGVRHLGIRRSRNAAEMRLGGAPVNSLAELAAALPVQVLDPTVHGLLDDGPRARRRFLDWGVFHVEQRFHAAWQRYGRALRQRNVLLRQEAPARDLAPWEEALAEAGTELHGYRTSYLAAISAKLRDSAANMLGIDDNVTVEYQGGWPEDSSLIEALAASRPRDYRTGTTQVGPHRADMVIRVGAFKAQDHVSRGQQKVLAGAMVLTQLQVYRAHTQRPAVLLADDLSAELDAAHLARFLALAQATGSQLFLTAIRPETLPADLIATARVFHVEHGQLRRA